ncbi:CLUMA_CG008687, isoform A [Clunio marinus]|uniref:CLUMA_CG008687, isoform A n=1 Tax=Clunio marinus TaxID=568069 RepID=A0A1J1I4P5_9DIPT|nr:CLUMA_CG008687, isoform A [Clunio marinus]
MANQSKLTNIPTTCIEYVHPWTDSCINATAGLLIVSALDSFRIYTIVYVASLLMRGRIPKRKDLSRTVLGIMQSTAFLTTSAFSYSAYLCFLRRVFGGFNIWTGSYIPAFMSSFTAILVERPSRRSLLTMYVANVATEALWRMASSRGMVKSIPYGQVLIFGLSTSSLLYYFRSGVHLEGKDSIYDIIRFIVGRDEEGGQKEVKTIKPEQSTRPRIKNNYLLIQKFLEMHKKVTDKLKALPKHDKCPHHHSCAYYTIRGGTKLFGIGLGIQVALKLVLNIQRIVKSPKKTMSIFFAKDTLKIGAFLGGFSFIYRFIACFLRHVTNDDKPSYSIPATMLASVAFMSYPDKTAALYIMWKALQITYNMLSDQGYLPKVPGGVIFLYCAFTAVLFHAATFEPRNLRPSYWKFLFNLSGGRISVMDRRSFDVWGLDTHAQIMKTIEMTRTGTDIKYTFGRW